MTATLKLEPRRLIGDKLEVAATLKGARVRQRTWWQIPSEHADKVTTWADPLVVGLLFPMMMADEDVHVEGRVSPSLLANLALYMALWETWHPGRYRAINISADEHAEVPAPPTNSPLIPFSTGVDSCYTAWRHQKQLAGPRSRTLQAAIIIRGFDIPLDRDHGNRQYQQLLDGSRPMLSSLNIQAIPVRTNLRQLPVRWEELHGAALISNLLLFSGYYAGALVPNSIPAMQLGTIWGSHPLSDPLLGSKNFPIADDGMEAPRWQKILALSEWPEARKHLDVCLEGVAPDGTPRNCCKCEKCLRTILAARVAGVPPFESFPIQPSRRDILRTRLDDRLTLNFWIELQQRLESTPHHSTAWARAIRRIIRRGHWRKWRREFLQPMLHYRAQIRHFFRGSEFSQLELRKRSDLAKGTIE